MKVTLTLTSRVGDADAIGYFRKFLPEYSRLERRIFHDFKSGHGEGFGMSRYVSSLCREFGFLKRTVNSARCSVSGKISSLRELRKDEIRNLGKKIGSLQKRIGKLEKTRTEMAAKASRNLLDEKALSAYRKVRGTLWRLKDKLHRMRQKLAKWEREKDVPRQCFGTRKLFRAQFHLEENGYRTHEGWRNGFRAKRDSNIFYLGSKGETSGNQMFTLSWKDGSCVLRIRKENAFVAEKNPGDKYLLFGLRIPRMEDELRRAVESGKVPITGRIIRKGRKFYACVSFDMDVDRVTDSSDGVVGIDFNDGHLEIVETDAKGNMIDSETMVMRRHGRGNAAKGEMRELMAKVSARAASRHKDIVIERLDFRDRKSETLPARGSGTRYNRMIHSLDYSRFAEIAEQACVKRGVLLAKVNPRDTSKIGRKKYSDSMKLSVHSAAAFVIARRGQGFTDKMPK